MIASFLLQSGVTLAVLYVIYWLFLRQLSFFEWIRFYLLAILFISVILPFITVSSFLPQQQLIAFPITWRIENILSMPKNSTNQELITPFDWEGTLLIIYELGIIFGMVRLGIQFLSLLKLKRRARFDNSLSLWALDEDICPFSFFSWVFVNPRLHTEKELNAILTHEAIHVKQLHTIDILLAELITIGFWYNPFAWLVRLAIKQNIEFFTDQMVLQEGISRKEYQYNLLKISHINTSLPLTNHFNINHLKTRINMMNRAQSKPIELLRFAICTPVLAILILFFNQVSIAQMASSKDEPTNSYYKVARAYYQEKNYINALEFAQKAIRQDDDAYNNNLLGLIFTQIKRLDLAERHLDKAISLNPNFADAFINKAHLLSLKGNDKEAMPFLEAALKLNTQTVELYKNLGVVYERSGDWQKAIEIWKQASVLFPNETGEFYYNIGLRYAQHQQMQEGIKWIKLGAKKGSINAIDVLKAQGLWDEKEVLEGK